MFLIFFFIFTLPKITRKYWFHYWKFKKKNSKRKQKKGYKQGKMEERDSKAKRKKEVEDGKESKRQKKEERGIYEKSPEEWDVGMVKNWFYSLSLAKDYSQLLEENEINGSILMEELKEKKDLAELGITLFGDVRRVLGGLSQLRQAKQSLEQQVQVSSEKEKEKEIGNEILKVEEKNEEIDAEFLMDMMEFEGDNLETNESVVNMIQPQKTEVLSLEKEKEDSSTPLKLNIKDAGTQTGASSKKKGKKVSYIDNSKYRMKTGKVKDYKPQVVKQHAPEKIQKKVVKKQVRLFDLKKPEGRISLRQLAEETGYKTFDPSECLILGVKQETLDVNFENALDYKFDSEEGKGKIGLFEITQHLIEAGANLNFLLPAWLENHYRLIVWKLASIEKCFPQRFGGKYLTYQNVLSQIKLRYERDLNNPKRNILQLISEGDDTPACYMVLCVTRVLNWGEYVDLKNLIPPAPTNNSDTSNINPNTTPSISTTPSNVPQTPNSNNNRDVMATIEVTDGWYCMSALLDKKLTEMLATGKIFVGIKLRICGSTLVGYEKPCPILELPPHVKLKLNVNGVRRAKWWTPLGKQKKFPFIVNLNSIKEEGGIVPHIQVIVQRQYPLVYYEEKVEVISEKETKKTFIVRSQKEEEIAKKEHETNCKRMIQHKMKEIEEETKKEEKERVQELKAKRKKKITKEGSSSLFFSKKIFYTFLSWKIIEEIERLEEGSDLMEAMEANGNEYWFRSLLNEYQNRILQEEIERHKQELREMMISELEKFKQKENVERVSHPVLNVLLSDFPPIINERTLPKIGKCFFSIWDASSKNVNDLKEGNILKICCVAPGKSFKFSKYPNIKSLGKRTCFDVLDKKKLDKFSLISPLPSPSPLQTSKTVYSSIPNTSLSYKSLQHHSSVNGMEEKELRVEVESKNESPANLEEKLEAKREMKLETPIFDRNSLFEGRKAVSFNEIRNGRSEVKCRDEIDCLAVFLHETNANEVKSVFFAQGDEMFVVEMKKPSVGNTFFAWQTKNGIVECKENNLLVFGIQNLEYSSFDSNCQLHLTKASNFTLFLKNPPQKYLNSQTQTLLQTTKPLLNKLLSHLHNSILNSTLPYFPNASNDNDPNESSMSLPYEEESQFSTPSNDILNSKSLRRTNPQNPSNRFLSTPTSTPINTKRQSLNSFSTSNNHKNGDNTNSGFVAGKKLFSTPNKVNPRLYSQTTCKVSSTPNNPKKFSLKKLPTIQQADTQTKQSKENTIQLFQSSIKEEENKIEKEEEMMISDEGEEGTVEEEETFLMIEKGIQAFQIDSQKGNIISFKFSSKVPNEYCEICGRHSNCFYQQLSQQNLIPSPQNKLENTNDNTNTTNQFNFSPSSSSLVTTVPSPTPISSISNSPSNSSLQTIFKIPVISKEKLFEIKSDDLDSHFNVFTQNAQPFNQLRLTFERMKTNGKVIPENGVGSNQNSVLQETQLNRRREVFSEIRKFQFSRRESLSKLSLTEFVVLICTHSIISEEIESDEKDKEKLVQLVLSNIFSQPKNCFFLDILEKKFKSGEEILLFSRQEWNFLQKLICDCFQFLYNTFQFKQEKKSILPLTPLESITLFLSK